MSRSARIGHMALDFHVFPISTNTGSEGRVPGDEQVEEQDVVQHLVDVVDRTRPSTPQTQRGSDAGDTTMGRQTSMTASDTITAAPAAIFSPAVFEREHRDDILSALNALRKARGLAEIGELQYEAFGPGIVLTVQSNFTTAQAVDDEERIRLVAEAVLAPGNDAISKQLPERYRGLLEDIRWDSGLPPWSDADFDEVLPKLQALVASHEGLRNADILGADLAVPVAESFVSALPELLSRRDRALLQQIKALPPEWSFELRREIGAEASAYADADAGPTTLSLFSTVAGQASDCRIDCIPSSIACGFEIVRTQATPISLVPDRLPSHLQNPLSAAMLSWRGWSRPGDQAVLRIADPASRDQHGAFIRHYIWIRNVPLAGPGVDALRFTVSVSLNATNLGVEWRSIPAQERVFYRPDGTLAPEAEQIQDALSADDFRSFNPPREPPAERCARLYPLLAAGFARFQERTGNPTHRLNYNHLFNALAPFLDDRRDLTDGELLRALDQLSRAHFIDMAVRPAIERPLPMRNRVPAPRSRLPAEAPQPPVPEEPVARPVSPTTQKTKLKIEQLKAKFAQRRRNQERLRARRQDAKAGAQAAPQPTAEGDGEAVGAHTPDFRS